LMFFSCSEVSCNLKFRSDTLTFIQYIHCHEFTMNFFKLLLFSLLCVSSSIVSTAPIAFQPVYNFELTLKPCAKLPTASQHFIFDSLDSLESGDHQSLQDLKSLLQDTCKNTLAAKQARKTAIVTIQLTCTEENVSVALKLTARKADGVIHTTLMLFVPDKADKEAIKAFEIFCRKAIPSLTVMQKHSGKIWLAGTLVAVAALYKPVLLARKKIIKPYWHRYQERKEVAKREAAYKIQQKQDQAANARRIQTFEDAPLTLSAEQEAELLTLNELYQGLIKSFGRHQEGIECLICYSLFSENEEWFSTKNCTCHEHFHKYCILKHLEPKKSSVQYETFVEEQWVTSEKESENKQECPTCRATGVLS